MIHFKKIKKRHFKKQLPLEYSIELLFAKKYVDAKNIIIFLSFSSALTSIYFLNTNVLSLDVKLVKLKTIGIIIGTTVSLLLGYFMTKYYGIIGASVSTLIGFFITTLILIYIVNKKTNFRFRNLRAIIFIILMFIIAFIDIRINILLYKIIFLITTIIFIFYIFEKELIKGVLNVNFNIKS